MLQRGWALWVAEKLLQQSRHERMEMVTGCKKNFGGRTIRA